MGLGLHLRVGVVTGVVVMVTEIVVVTVDVSGPPTER